MSEKEINLNTHPKTFEVITMLTLSSVDGERSPTVDDARIIVEDAMHATMANGTDIPEVAIDSFYVTG